VGQLFYNRLHDHLGKTNAPISKSGLPPKHGAERIADSAPKGALIAPVKSLFSSEKFPVLLPRGSRLKRSK
jgi:hypothetical protein